jgi:hypothetical protein
MAPCVDDGVIPLDVGVYAMDWCAMLSVTAAWCCSVSGAQGSEASAAQDRENRPAFRIAPPNCWQTRGVKHVLSDQAEDTPILV